MMVSSTRPHSVSGFGSSKVQNNSLLATPQEPPVNTFIEQFMNTELVSTDTQNNAMADAASFAASVFGTQQPVLTQANTEASTAINSFLSGMYPSNSELLDNAAFPSSQEMTSEPAFWLTPNAATSSQSLNMLAYGIAELPLDSQASGQHNGESQGVSEASAWNWLAATPEPNILSPPPVFAQAATSNGISPASCTFAAHNPLLATCASQIYSPSVSATWPQSLPATAVGASFPRSETPASTEPAMFQSLSSLTASQSPRNASFLSSAFGNPSAVDGSAAQAYYPVHDTVTEQPAPAFRRSQTLQASYPLSQTHNMPSLSPSPFSDSGSNQGGSDRAGPFKAEGGWKNQPRNSISRKQKRVFYKWLLDNTKFPFPTETDRLSCLCIDQISEKQFKYWFANIRCRQFSKQRDPNGNLYFAPNAKFYESCLRLGLPIRHGIPPEIRQAMRLPRKNSLRQAW
ncbi:hypothetical protein EV183_000959 [Coemansia sp. RSA 2336]|nr:hypothetical protein EV183_000959 [Coemansia sp. RSA 2336]